MIPIRSHKDPTEQQVTLYKLPFCILKLQLEGVCASASSLMFLKSDALATVY